MNDDDRSKLGELYPKAKTYAELKYERKVINELRRPKRVAIRIAARITIGIAISLLAISAMFAIMSGNLSSTGQVLALVCVAILIGLAAMAVVGYICVSINNLVSKVLINSSSFYLFHSLLLVCSIGLIILARTSDNIFLTIVLVLTATFLASAGITQLIIRSQKSQ